MNLSVITFQLKFWSTKWICSKRDSIFCSLNLAIEASVMVSGPLYVRRGATFMCSIRVNSSLQLLREINIVAAWMRGNVQLIDNNHTNISDTISNGPIFETNVTFVPLQFSDSGNYSCEVTLFSIATGNMLFTRSSMIFFAVEGEFWL